MNAYDVVLPTGFALINNAIVSKVKDLIIHYCKGVTGEYCEIFKME